MKIVINKEARILNVNEGLILPGTNVFEKFDESTKKTWIENDLIEVYDADKMTAKEVELAIKEAVSVEVIEKLKNLKACGEKGKKAAESAKKQIEEMNAEFDKQVSEAEKNKGKQNA